MNRRVKCITVKITFRKCVPKTGNAKSFIDRTITLGRKMTSFCFVNDFQHGWFSCCKACNCSQKDCKVYEYYIKHAWCAGFYQWKTSSNQLFLPQGINMTIAMYQPKLARTATNIASSLVTSETGSSFYLVLLNWKIQNSSRMQP